MYIGPQGIVHGTTITLLNAAVSILASAMSRPGGYHVHHERSWGMSGAQAKAATIAGAACIIAETNAHAAHKRHEQGWLTTVTDSIDDAIDRMVTAANQGQAISIGLVGNIVELWERCVERNIHVDLGSDQPASIIPTREATSQPIGPTRKALLCYRKTRSNFAQKYRPRFGDTQPPSTSWQNGDVLLGLWQCVSTRSLPLEQRSPTTTVVRLPILC